MNKTALAMLAAAHHKAGAPAPALHKNLLKKKGF